MLNTQKHTTLFSLGLQPGIKSVFFIFLIVFEVFCLKAQENLVPNGDFEEYWECPQNGEIFNAKYFSSPSLSSPDYFNVCATQSNNTSVPSNLGGYQEPRSGFGYAGIVAHGLGTNYKEYVQTSLTKPLEYGKLYSVKFYVSLGSFASVGCNNLGVHFSDQLISVNNNSTLFFNNPLSSNTIIKDTLNWVEMSFIYQSEGNEKFLIIGNFFDDLETDTLNCNYALGDNYYYIDDISVTEIQYQIPNVFTPNNDSNNDFWFFNFVENSQVLIFDRWGNIIYHGIGPSFAWDGKNCSDGVYYYKLQYEDVIKTGFIQLIR